MSYVGKKNQLFRDKPMGKTAALQRKRSEGRMKRIESCMDNRAWCMDEEERRRYFLELVANPPMGGDGSAVGRYVPVGTLIDSLQATKNSQIDVLAQQVADLEQQLEAYRQLNLTDEQKAQLEKLLQDVKTSKRALDDSKRKMLSRIPISDSAPITAQDSIITDQGSTISGQISEQMSAQDSTPISAPALSTQVLYKRDQDGTDSSGAESDMDESELKKLLLRKESQIISLKNQLAAKIQELAEKDKAMKAAVESVENVSSRVDENSDLRKQMENHQTELNNIKNQSSDECEALRREKDALAEKLSGLANIEAAYLELKRKSDSMDDVIAERDMLRMRLKDYDNIDNELEDLRFRAKEADVMRMERDRLKDRNNVLATFETAYLKLLEETKDYDTLVAERAMNRSKNNDGRKELDQAKKDLEQERDTLKRDLKEYECAIADQEDEIKRLLLTVEKLTTTTNSKEDRMQKGLSELRLQIDNKDERISLLENQLAELPNLEAEIKLLKDRLKNTIVGVAQEKDQLDNLSKTESKLRADMGTLEAELQNERRLSKSLKDKLNNLSSSSAQPVKTGQFSEEEMVAKINALQNENDALKASLEALKGAAGGGIDLAEELDRERKARLYAEEMCREAVDTLEKMTADKEKEFKAKLGAASPSEKELVRHSEKKFEEEKKEKEMLQGVLDFTQDELENEKVARRKCEERIKQLEQAMSMDSKGSEVSRKDALDIANELEQLKKQNDLLKKSIAGSQTDLQKSQFEMFDKVQALEKQIKELLAENAELRKSDAIRDEQEKVLRLQLESIQDLLKEEQKNAKIQEQLNDKVKSLEAVNAELRKGLPTDTTSKPSTTGADEGRFKELLLKIKDLEVENADLKKGLPSGTTPKPSTTGAGADNNVIVKDLEQKIRDLETENANLKKGPLGATSKPSTTGADDGRFKELLMKIKDLEVENADLKKGLPSGTTPKPSTTGAGADNNVIVKDLEKKIRDLEAENANLRKGLPLGGEETISQDKAAYGQLGAAPKSSTTGPDIIIKDLEKKIEDSEKKIRDLEAENADLRKGLPSSTTPKPSTTGAGADNNVIVKDLEKKIRDLEAENADLRKGLPSGTTPKPSTTGAGADNNVIVKDLEKKIRDLEAENANLRKGLPLGGEETISQDKAAYGQLGAAPKSSTTGPDIIIKDLEKKIKDLEKKIRDLEAEDRNSKKVLLPRGEETVISADKAAYGQLGAAPKASSGFSNQGLEKRLKELEAENLKLKNTNEELEKNLKNRANELQAANDNLKRMQLSPDDRAKFDNELDARNRAEKAEMEALIAQLEGQVKSFKNQDSSKFTESSGKSPGTNAEIDRLEKKCALLEAEIEKLKKEKTGLVDSYEHRIAGLTESFENRLKMRTKESMIRLHESIEKFKQTLSPEDHAANIIAVETKSVKSMAAMKEAYEKRIADIIAANSKDKETTNKVHTSNLSTLKETYERDIKMLNERHNASITQLQSLHEAEVQEMNSELDSEVKRLSSWEIEMVKKNQEEMVKSMKKRHQEEMENLQNKQKDYKMNAEDDFKRVTSNQSGYDYNRAKLEYEAELQRMKDSNKNKIEVLKVKYTELMEEERRKNKGRLGSKILAQSRTEVYDLRPTGAGGEVDNQVDLRSQTPSVLGVDDILRKALAHGFESLMFDELSTLHERCCSSTARMIMENPALKLAPMKFTLQGADKQQLCSRIACLEQEIARRQFETQKRVNMLESTVKHEKRRLGEVKDALTRSLTQEQRRSLELHSRLGTQTQQQAEIESERDMLRRQLAYHEEKAKTAIQQLEKEKSKNRIMSEDLIKERNNIKHLQSLLEAERTRAKSSNLKESDLIETLRIKLETALDNEARMKFKYEKLEALYNSSQVPTNQHRPVGGSRPVTSSCAESCRAPCNTHCKDTCPAPCTAARLQDLYERQVHSDRADLQKGIFMQQCSTHYKKKSRHSNSSN